MPTGDLATQGLVQYGITIEIHLKLKSRESSFHQNIYFNCEIVFHCIKHGSDAAVICFSKFQTIYQLSKMY